MEKDYAQQNPNAGAPSENCVRLFGVKLTDCNYHNVSNQMGIMRKSVSMGNLGLMGFNALQRQSGCVGCTQPRAEFGAAHPRLDGVVHGDPQQGYASDGLMQSSSVNLRERKKGVPWTEDEHRLFLAGLQKLGKGDWRGISRNFVTSRTPTQVASHAQKYFLRQGNLNKRKRRSSLFDIINSNMVPGTNVIGDNSQTFGAVELVRPPLELSSQLVTASSNSLLDSLPAYSKPPSSVTPSVCADLCLGSSHSRQWQVSDENVSSVLSRSRKQGSMMDALPPTQLHSSNKSFGLDDAMGSNCKNNKSICTISSSSSSSKSISSSASLCRIDEMSELSSLSLSIGPPMSMEASELALKLEQPVTSRLSVSPSAKVSELKEVLLTVRVGTVAGNTNKVTGMANAIRVV